MTGLSGLSLKYFSQSLLNSGPISFNSCSVGRIFIYVKWAAWATQTLSTLTLKPASIELEDSRAFSGLTSHSWNSCAIENSFEFEMVPALTSFWTSLSPRRKSSTVLLSLETRKTNQSGKPWSYYLQNTTHCWGLYSDPGIVLRRRGDRWQSWYSIF